MIVLALLLGSASHLLWDSFTHSHSYDWPVQNSEYLRSVAFYIGDYPLKVYRLLQHGSSIIGLLVVYFWVWRWYRQTDRQDVFYWQAPIGLRRAAFWSMLLVPIGFGLYWASVLVPEGSAAFRTLMFTRDVAIFGGRAFLLMWLSWGMVYQYARLSGR